MTPPATNITFIGFGEAAQAFARGLSDGDTALRRGAFDIKTNGRDTDAKRKDYEDCGVTGFANIGAACAHSDVIFSMVTADQALVAATEAAQTDLHNALYLDCNSCAPETKKNAAVLVETAGGRYVDVAIMTPVHPKRHQAPCLLAGPNARFALETMLSLGMNATIAGENVGDASTRKMIRSVMVKGLEALTIECFLAARQAGIEDDVLASLDTSYAGFDWPRLAPYMLERAITHGTRRAAEMEEVAKTLSDLGITPHVTEATIARQREIGALSLDADAIDAKNLTALTSSVLAALSSETPD